jgi:Neurotransmitter-gated ion-channel ligand binding domain
MVYFLFLCTVFLSAFNHTLCSEENSQHWVESSITSPPANLPVTVNISLNFLHLVAIDEHDETFTADVYLHCRWKDPRLSYSAPEGSYPKTYIGDSCKEKLNRIWRPDMEFVNSGAPEYTNRSLFIHPDGTVDLNQAVTGTFRNKFDYRKLPFDRQNLQIILSSFSWDDRVVVFKIENEGVQFGRKLKAAYEEINILGMNANVDEEVGLQTTDSKGYSVFTATLTIQRAPLFYSYQVFFPLLVVVGLTCSVFFIPAEIIGDKMMIVLTSVLIFIATKFLINQDLPKIGYLTFVDKIFFISYAYAGLMAIFCIVEYGHWKRKDPNTEKLAKMAGIFFPAAYLLACGIRLLSEIL